MLVNVSYKGLLTFDWWFGASVIPKVRWN